MGANSNKDLVERFFSFLNHQEHVNVLPSLLDDPFTMNGVPDSCQALQDLILMLRSAFPDERLTVETLIVEDDYVVARLTSHATHTGTWISPVGPIAPTGKQVTQTGMHIFRMRGERIAELWTEWDVVGLLQQLDVIGAGADT